MPVLLFVTTSDVAHPRGGRAMLSALHCRTLDELPGIAVALHRLTPEPASARQALRGYIDGVTPGSIDRTIDRIARERIGHVWLDGSNLGLLARAIRRRLPDVTILTFCHNVEARFFRGAFRHAPRPKSLAVLVANYLAERQAARSSHRLIALSDRDSRGLARLYGRGATDILPMAIADQAGRVPDPSGPVATDAPLLFVGGAFYANRAGIAWFARHVAPRIAVPTVVVGQGMETMRAALETAAGVRVVGAVDGLESWYRQARVAVAPIFDGSGMKTKVAEALMFGRPVIGTPEAFSGYEAVADRAGWVCGTADEFVTAIRAAAALPLVSCDPALRALYDRHYSIAATAARLATILAMAGCPTTPSKALDGSDGSG